MSSPSLTLDITRTSARDVWPLFAPHHYLTSKYAGHRGWLVTLPDATPVAFTSIIAAPSGHFSNGWREHRTVVLPDFQGLGIGARLGDWLGEYVVTYMTEGRGRFYSRTLHPRLAAYRDASPRWSATSHNKKAQSGSEVSRMGLGAPERVAFAHRYVSPNA